MLAITHSAIAAAGTCVILRSSHYSLSTALLRQYYCTIGKICFSISSWIEDRFPHRSITHSLLATASLTALSLGVNFSLHGSLKERASQLQKLGFASYNAAHITNAD